MSHSRRAASNEPIIDDYPVRPNTQNEAQLPVSKKLEGRHRTTILFSLVYFLYGSGISMYGLLYPSQARKNGINSCIYGPVIGTSHFVCVLVYPVACQMVSKVSFRNAFGVSVFIIGACRILFGSLSLISQEVSFIAISYAIQGVEGIGVSILIASTIVRNSTLSKDQIKIFLYSLQAFLSLGLILGPLGGQVLKKELGFDIPFYVIGGLTVLCFPIVAVLIKEPEQEVTYADMPVIYWIKDTRMLIYFFIVFASFNYVGYLSVLLEHILKQFHQNYLYAALVFSIPPFAYALTFPGWIWLIKKGFNNVMLIFVGAIVIFASLALLGPVPYTSLEASFPYVCWGLALEGLGIACKSTCVLDAAERDLSYQKKYTEIQQRFILPTVFLLGASMGYFCGSLTAGFTDFYIGYRKGTLPLFGLEICIAMAAVIFAMNRNYVSRRHREIHGESQPILRS